MKTMTRQKIKENGNPRVIGCHTVTRVATGAIALPPKGYSWAAVA